MGKQWNAFTIQWYSILISAILVVWKLDQACKSGYNGNEVIHCWGLWEGEENTPSAPEGIHCSERLSLKIRRRTSGYCSVVKRTVLWGECHGWISTRLPQWKEHKCKQKHPSQEIPADTFVRMPDQFYINVLSSHLSFSFVQT